MQTSARNRLAGTMAIGILGLAPVASAGTPGGPVGTTAAAYTPSLHWTGTTTQVRQLIECGTTMYAVGTFTAIDQGGQTYQRNRAFSFSATTGVVTAWNPNVNGRVNTVAVSADCATAYLGGAFTAVGSTSAQNLAAVSTGTGAVLTGFGHSANNQVQHIVLSGAHVIVGGYFTGVNGGTHPYLSSLNPSTGADDGYLQVPISGRYLYTDQGGTSSQGGATQVMNMKLSPDGSRLLVVGTFTSVSRHRRHQIFMLDLGPTVSLDKWYSLQFNAYCDAVEPFYVRAASWSPDGRSVYVATTGYRPARGPGYDTSQPRAGLCDAAAAFPSTRISTLSPSWVNYTGCDSYYSVAADTNDVYVGGHQRWTDNPGGCDAAGPGALSRPGVAAVAPSTGLGTSWNPTRSRGLGADDLLVTTHPAGLWIASDNLNNAANYCAGSRHPGICFLPA